MTATRRQLAIQSDIRVLSNYGVRPHQMARARAYLSQGYSHEKAAEMACRS